MGWNLKQVDDNTLQIIDDSSNAAPMIEFGRGTTDTDVVYLLLRNADGEISYIYPNATQTGIIVQATKP